MSLGKVSTPGITSCTWTQVRNLWKTGFVAKVPELLLRKPPALPGAREGLETATSAPEGQ